MKKTIKLTLLSFAFALSFFAQAQIPLTRNAQISILTIAPGNELVDSFGHSAFRVRDPFLSIDYVFNYGTYNFDTPNFYGKFAQGKLLYEVRVDTYNRFIYGYTAQNRTVVEQILNLTKDEKQSFFEFLQNNIKPENKLYLYDFFFDNCATKLRDVSEEILPGKIAFNYTFDDPNLTFRELIHNNLDKQPWGKFGIDLALGSVIDRKATPQEYLFLPDYIYKSFEKGSINNKPLVRITRTIFEATPAEEEKSLLSPLLIFSFLALIVSFITFNDYKKKKRSIWLDLVLFLFTGSVGLVVLLLWVATDHSATQQNYNILWAFLPNLPIAFFLLKAQLNPWLRRYFQVLIGLLLVTAVFWILKIQIFSVAVLPILLLLLVRYLYLMRITVKNT